MKEFKELFQGGDWKTEKHVPEIEAPETVSPDELFRVTVGVGREVSHPNKTEHYIAWIALYFQPEDEKFPYQVGKVDFTAHGASARGADTSGVYTHHEGMFSMKTAKGGTLYAESYCNVHGLWQHSRPLSIGS
jgi:superoxide reductase